MEIFDSAKTVFNWNCYIASCVLLGLLKNYIGVLNYSKVKSAITHLFGSLQTGLLKAKCLVCISILAAFFMFPHVAAANTLAQVLSLYGSYLDVVDVDMYMRDLDRTEMRRFALISMYNRDEFFRSVADVVEATTFKTQDFAAQLEEDKRYLIALVNKGADLELIFEAENEYRVTRRRLEQFTYGRTEFSLDSYNLSGVTEEDIAAVAQQMEAIQRRIGEASYIPDIGSLYNLQSPTRELWRVTSGFGFRINPITGQGREFHNGLDLAAPSGTDVLALFTGRVIFAGFRGGYGYSILISHSNELQTFYAHLSRIDVRVGDRVYQNQKIGEVGTTGRSTGPHLHLGVFVDGRVVDPVRIFTAN